MASIEEHPVWKEIDASDYLFLQKLYEPRDNSLTIVLDQAVANPANVEGLHRVLATLPEPLRSRGGSLIEPTQDCSIFTLHWKSYVAYNVTEETHGSTGLYDEQRYSGKLLRIYSSSNYLDFISKDTGAHFNPYQHYKIACQNHIIDVVSTLDPTLTAILRSEAGLE
jgi:hypothetical protein